MRVFAGPRPAEVLARFSARVGRQPPAAAPFYFGPWFQPTGGDEANLRTLTAAGAPASVAQTYTHYLPCGDQQGKTDAERGRVQRFHDAGLAVTTYFNPMICTGYDPRYAQARDRGLLTRNQLDQPYEYRYTGSTQFLVGQFDFSAPGATGFFGELLGEAVGGRPRRLDGGLRRVHAARREVGERDDRPADAQPLPRPLPRRGVRLQPPRASAAGALQPLGLDRGRARCRRSCGAATRRPTGASTACGPPCARA